MAIVQEVQTGRRDMTVSELQAKLAVVAKKSTQRKRSLKQLTKVHMLTKRVAYEQHEELVDLRRQHQKVYNAYNEVMNKLDKHPIVKRLLGID